MFNALFLSLLLFIPSTAFAGRWLYLELCTQDGIVHGPMKHDGFMTHGRAWIDSSRITVILPLTTTDKCSLVEMGQGQRAIVKGTPAQLFCAGIGGPVCIGMDKIQ